MEDTRPTKFCDNQGCAAKNIEVKTNQVTCVMCSRPLAELSDMEALFSRFFQ